ncbi:unnamed protein product [Clonostachys rhizophaga]|uniref:Uncharacterized protein n=1 Tax=Clonostachys rhizophaga TaxID=160324 RepID=A0A9N9V4Z5_9HYPO|nr:unnamed protein product [Clonostachys rhizophaga]
MSITQRAWGVWSRKGVLRGCIPLFHVHRQDEAAAAGMSIDVDAVVGGMTDLYAACLKGRTTIIEFLLKHRPNVSKSLCQP